MYMYMYMQSGDSQVDYGCGNVLEKEAVELCRQQYGTSGTVHDTEQLQTIDVYVTCHCSRLCDHWGGGKVTISLLNHMHVHVPIVHHVHGNTCA